MIRLKFFLRSLFAIFQKKYCPYCGGTDLTFNQRKYIVTSLLKCNNCELLHRHPKDPAGFTKKFYQTEYKIDVEMMTDLPSASELEVFRKNIFKDLRDYFPLIKPLYHQTDGIKVLDYGCSWGYNVYKFKNDGLDAVGYELSVPRAKFGEENLGVKIYSDEGKIRLDNDVVFSSHVIEHLNFVQDFFALSKRILKEDGIFMAVCPNGSREYQDRDPARFKGTWGVMHPLYLDIDFATHVFKNNPYLILTADWPFDYEKIKNWNGKSQYIGPREGYELLIITKPNININSLSENGKSVLDEHMQVQ